MKRRHQLILTLIAEQVIETQDELVAALRPRVARHPATVSRDIKELRLAKVARPTDGTGMRCRPRRLMEATTHWKGPARFRRIRDQRRLRR